MPIHDFITRLFVPQAPQSSPYRRAELDIQLAIPPTHSVCGMEISMQDRNMDKALEIFSALITGDEISAKNKDTAALYDEYSNNSEVYDIVTAMCRKMNLSLYEYMDSLYVSPGDNNRVFGFSNEELKRIIGVKLNRELYLCYFIVYAIMTRFYSDTSNPTSTEYVKSEDIINAVDSMLADTLKSINLLNLDEIEDNSFQAVSATWEDLPLVSSEEGMQRASRGSKTGFVKLVFNFMEKQSLLVENEGRYYPSSRMKALVENYYEENKGRLYEIMKGVSGDATH